MGRPFIDFGAPSYAFAPKRLAEAPRDEHQESHPIPRLLSESIYSWDPSILNTPRNLDPSSRRPPAPHPPRPPPYSTLRRRHHLDVYELQEQHVDETESTSDDDDDEPDMIEDELLRLLHYDRQVASLDLPLPPLPPVPRFRPFARPVSSQEAPRDPPLRPIESESVVPRRQRNVSEEASILDLLLNNLEAGEGGMARENETSGGAGGDGGGEGAMSSGGEVVTMGEEGRSVAIAIDDCPDFHHLREPRVGGGVVPTLSEEAPSEGVELMPSSDRLEARELVETNPVQEAPLEIDFPLPVYPVSFPSTPAWPELPSWVSSWLISRADASARPVMTTTMSTDRSPSPPVVASAPDFIPYRVMAERLVDAAEQGMRGLRVSSSQLSSTRTPPSPSPPPPASSLPRMVTTSTMMSSIETTASPSRLTSSISTMTAPLGRYSIGTNTPQPLSTSTSTLTTEDLTTASTTPILPMLATPVARPTVTPATLERLRATLDQDERSLLATLESSRRELVALQSSLRSIEAHRRRALDALGEMDKSTGERTPQI